MTILDDPEVRDSVFPVSVAFYHEAGRLGLIGEDVELLEGVLFKKMPKSPLHEWLIEFLRRRLEEVCPENFFVGKERPITCTSSEPEPDLAVIAGSWLDYRDHHPDTAELVIEIAINTLRRDRSKASIYAGAGVKEYWLVEPETKQITVFTEPLRGDYAQSQTFALGQSAKSNVLPGFSLEMGQML